jgi:hypothetical protein
MAGGPTCNSGAKTNAGNGKGSAGASGGTRIASLLWRKDSNDGRVGVATGTKANAGVSSGATPIASYLFRTGGC